MPTLRIRAALLFAWRDLSGDVHRRLADRRRPRRHAVGDWATEANSRRRTGAGLAAFAAIELAIFVRPHHCDVRPERVIFPLPAAPVLVGRALYGIEQYTQMTDGGLRWGTWTIASAVHNFCWPSAITLGLWPVSR